MLQGMREKTQGWVAMAIIGVLMVAFFFWGIEFYLAQFGANGDTVAKVNGKKISTQQLNAEFQRMVQQAQAAQKGAPLAEAARAQLKQYTLQNLITNLALAESAYNLGFRFTLDQTKQLILRAPEFQVQGRFSPQRFQQLLYANSISQPEFMRQLQSSLVQSQLVNGIRGTAFVGPQALAFAYELLKQKRSFGYFLIPIDRFEGKSKVSDADINNYYAQNQAQFRTEEKVSVSYVMLAPSEMQKQTKVSDAQLQQYYQDNKANFHLPKRWQVQRITVLVPSDASSEQVAAAEKSMQKIASQAAQMPHLLQQKVAGQIRTTEWISEADAKGNMAFILSKLQPQHASAVFRDEQGFTVVRLVKAEPARQKSFAEVKDSLHKALQQQQIAQGLNDKSQALGNLTYTNPSALEPAAKELGLTIHTTPLLTRAGDKSGILANPKILAAVFSDDVLQGNNSNPIALNDGTVVVVRIGKREPSRVLPLAQVKQTIVNKLQHELAQREAGLVAYKVQEEFLKGAGLNQIIAKYPALWISKPDIARGNKSAPQSIMAAAFSLTPSKKPSAESVNTVSLPNGSFAVLHVMSASNAKFADATAKEKQSLAMELARFHGQMAYQFYMNGVIDKAKIKVYQQNLQ